MQKRRVHELSEAEERSEGTYVLYWMQQAQRERFNHALELAIHMANKRDRPLIVGFGLMDDYPEANLRHYAFMLEGLAETAQRLSERGLKLVMRKGHPADVALELARDAVLVVCDAAYLRHQRQWRERLAGEAGCRVLEVETDIVVPIREVSDKAAVAARTIRPRIERQHEAYLQPLEPVVPAKSSLPLHVRGDLDPRDVDGTLASLTLDRSVSRSERFKGGSSEARARLERFIENKLDGYATGRNEPIAKQCSELSPYLHFGQISPVEVAMAVRETKKGEEKDRASFLEELIVRRELAMNFVAFTDDYDRYSCLPGWARQTMEAHADDERAYVYERHQLEQGETHDRYWNAAMREMRMTGYMHNYMRMYWGKKILEWSRTPKQAYETTLAINNKYFLDGRDPSSFANVGWIFGLHDRGWTERPVFGKIRYMNANGLRRKFKIDAYADWAEGL